MDTETGDKAEATETEIGSEATTEEPKKRGRPRKQRDERPLSGEPPPRSRKAPEDIHNTTAAIHATHERMRALVEIHREKFPESEIGDPVNPLDEKREKQGAPMEKSAFHAPVIGLTRIAGWLGGLDEEELPKQSEYDRVASSWARASTHLGLSEKAAAIFSAASETVGVVGFTIARSIKKAFFSPKEKTDIRGVEDGPIDLDGKRKAASDADGK